MKNDHLIYYFSIFALLSSGLALIVYLAPRKDLQMITLIGISVLYALVGITHHLINHDLVFKIVVEYVLVAALGVALAFFIFKGGIGI